MEMNQKTAFKILGLGPGASLDQVKKAFRDLAKQYHPDRFSPDRSPIDEIGPAPAAARLNRMKEINQAFHFLVPLLTPTDALTEKASTDKPPSPKQKKATGDKDPSFLDILRRLKKGLKFYRKSVRQPGPCVQPPLTPTERQKNKPVKTVRFATILNTLHPDRKVDKKSRGCGRDCRNSFRDSRGLFRVSGNHPYSNFLKYMALKKQIAAGNRPGGEQHTSRIEKIRPVTRVNPIGNKQKS